MNSVSIEIPSLSENIRMIESFIDNAKEQYHLDDDIYGNIMIAVTESVHNAIKHGNKCDVSKTVLLTLTLQDNAIRFIIRDQGEGFDYENLPDPTSPENIDQPGGRGIFLMKHLSDEVTFSNQGSVIELAFYIN